MGRWSEDNYGNEGDWTNRVRPSDLKAVRREEAEDRQRPRKHADRHSVGDREKRIHGKRTFGGR